MSVKKLDKKSLIVSSRIRLARNMSRVPFKTKDVDAFDSIAATVKKSNPQFKSARIDQLSGKIAQALFEQHLISRDLLHNTHNGMIVTNEGDTSGSRVCVMLGEEDHIRIQVINVGCDLESAYATAAKISTDITKNHKIARHPKLGYLTSCPTNLGTGMRASVMMFLPALSLSGKINGAINDLRRAQITVRGVYGEGSRSSGFMYQLSNQCTLNLTEADIIKRVNNAVDAVARAEFATQAELFATNPDQITNQVMRSFGILTHSHMISSEEATEHLAWLKLGDCLGLVKFKPRILDDLFFVIQPATISYNDARGDDANERDKLRAKKIISVLRTARIK